MTNPQGIHPRPRYGRPDPMRDPEGYMRWLVADPVGPGELQPVAFPVIEESYIIGPSAAPAPKRWYVVVTEPQKERSVCDDLERDGIEPFSPKVKLYKFRRAQSEAGRIAYTRPLLPRYVFAGLPVAAGGILRVEGYRHAINVLRRSGEAASVPAEQVEALRLREAAGEFDQTGPPAWIVPGLGIRITEGAFASYDGCLKHVNRARRRVKAEVMIFGRATHVELAIGQFEACIPPPSHVDRSKSVA